MATRGFIAVVQYAAAAPASSSMSALSASMATRGFLAVVRYAAAAPISSSMSALAGELRSITELAPPPWDAAQKAGGSGRHPPQPRGMNDQRFPLPPAKGKGQREDHHDPLYSDVNCDDYGDPLVASAPPRPFFAVPAMAALEIWRRLSKARRPQAKTWGASIWTLARWERWLLIAAAAARGRDEY